MTKILWSEERSAPLDDRWQAHLERGLGLTFHGIHNAAASTVAHRFLFDAPFGALLLRVRLRPEGAFVVELVVVGAPAAYDSETISRLQAKVRNVLRGGPDQAWLPSATSAAMPTEDDVSGLLLDLGSALHGLAWSNLEAMSPLERRRLGDSLREALGPMRTAAEIAEITPADEAQRMNNLLVKVVGETVGLGDYSKDQSPRRGGVPKLGEVLRDEIAQNPEALLNENTFESMAARFLADLDLAMAEWNRAATVGSSPEPGRAPRLTRATMSTVLSKLDARTRQTRSHVVGIIDLSAEHRIRLYYSVGVRGELSSGLSAQFRRTMGLNEAEFGRLISCAMTRDEFIAVARGRLR